MSSLFANVFIPQLGMEPDEIRQLYDKIKGLLSRYSGGTLEEKVTYKDTKKGRTTSKTATLVMANTQNVVELKYSFSNTSSTDMLSLEMSPP